MNSEEQLKILLQKVQQLVKEYNALKKENIVLQKEVQANAEMLKEKNQSTEKLQEKIDGLNLTAQIWNADDKEKLQKRIDGYLKEVDKCLQILNQ